MNKQVNYIKNYIKPINLFSFYFLFTTDETIKNN